MDMQLESERSDGGAPSKILVVEDEQIVALELKDRLAQMGHVVAGVVGSGEEAVEQASRVRPDLVLMDIKLQGKMDGVEAAEAIRREAGEADVAIVYLTAFADDATLARAKLTEPYGYILKPFQERELHVVVEVALYRHRAAQALRESEAWRDALFRSVADAVVAADAGGRVRLINPLACALTGWTEEEAIGRPLDEVLRMVVAPSGGAGTWQATLSKTLIARDGTRRPIDAERTTIRTDGRPAPSLAPSLGTVWAFRDVSERKRLEDRQRFMATASGEVASSLDRASILHGMATLITSELADGCAIHLRGEDGELEVAAASAAVPSWLSAAAQKVADSGRPLFTSEAIIVPLTARGQSLGTLCLLVLEESGARALSDADLPFVEELGRRVAAGLDNAQLYADAQRAIRLREDVLAIISHDLRNPLSSILMNADQLLRTPAKNTPERIAKNAGTIRGGAEQMSRLIDDLLDVGRIDGGRLSLTLERVGTRGVLDEALSMFDAVASPRAIQLVRGAFPDVDLLCDRERVIQIVSNLIANALKLSPSGGAIGIRAESDGRALLVSVSDAGSGISAEQQKHVFDRYGQAPASLRKGLGLGLYIAKGLVEAQGGRIWCESTPGAGSTFSFTIPLADPGEHDPVEQKGPGPW
jgi:PAS domain S-box-containing protein